MRRLNKSAPRLEGVEDKHAEQALSMIEAGMSDAMMVRIGSMPIDGVYFFDVLPDGVKMFIGERDTMRRAFVKDSRITAGDTHDLCLRSEAPRGFGWVVIDWGEYVTTAIFPLGEGVAHVAAKVTP